MHRRVLIGLGISQILLMGLLSTKDANKETLVLLAQPIFTIWFYVYCKGRFESVFVKFSLEVGKDYAYNSFLYLSIDTENIVLHLIIYYYYFTIYYLHGSSKIYGLNVITGCNGEGYT